MKWYQVLAAPVALLYGLAVVLRNGLYKAKMLPTHRVSVPTISVGNLAVGGTGKTPFVEYLIRMLSPHYHVAVLSRGYKRKSRGFVLAKSDATAQTIGDEAMQIHTKYPKVPVAVCKDRVEGIHQLQKLYPKLQAVILDDAFQYRRLRCGFNILLTAYNHLYIDDYFLPMGRLRDARMESLRADAVVVTKCPQSMLPIDRRIVDTKLHLPTFQQLCFSTIEYPELPEKKRVLLLTGIAHPEYLLKEVEAHNKIVKHVAYPDHYRFTNKEIARISVMAEKYDVVLTTEKDYMRLLDMALPKALADKLQCVAISITVTNADNLERQLRQYINENLQPKK